MAKKAQEGGVSRSQAVHDVLKENPKITFAEAVATLAEKGIKFSKATFYFVKGSMAGQKSRRKKHKRKAVSIATASTSGGPTTPAATKSDALSTIRKVKGLAVEVGGLRTLKGLVDALSE